MLVGMIELEDGTQGMVVGAPDAVQTKKYSLS